MCIVCNAPSFSQLYPHVYKCISRYIVKSDRIECDLICLCVCINPK